VQKLTETEINQHFGKHPCTTLVPAQSMHKHACKHIVHRPSNHDKAPLDHIQNTYAIFHIHRQRVPRRPPQASKHMHVFIQPYTHLLDKLPTNS
jgi:hypothetical protein